MDVLLSSSACVLNGKVQRIVWKGEMLGSGQDSPTPLSRFAHAGLLVGGIEEMVACQAQRRRQFATTVNDASGKHHARYEGRAFGHMGR